MSKLFAGLLIAVAAMAGIYAVAATTATSMAAGFNTTETSDRTRIIEFAAEMKRTSAEHKAARAKCDRYTVTLKASCNAEAKAEQKRARSEARVNYKGSSKSPADAVVKQAKAARDFDVALYRVHRQLPD